jgi:hypothetical protein
MGYVRYDTDEQLDRVALGSPLDTTIEILADLALDDWFARVERAQGDAIPFLVNLYALPDIRAELPPRKGVRSVGHTSSSKFGTR